MRFPERSLRGLILLGGLALGAAAHAALDDPSQPEGLIIIDPELQRYCRRASWTATTATPARVRTPSMTARMTRSSSTARTVGRSTESEVATNSVVVMGCYPIGSARNGATRGTTGWEALARKEKLSRMPEVN